MFRLSLAIALVWGQQITPRERLVDMEHMRLQVRFAPERGTVYGIVTHVFTPLRPGVDSLILDAVKIEVEDVRHRDQPVKFRTTGEQLIIRFPERLQPGARDSITIRYMATPRKGIYFIGWRDKTGRARKQIWTQGQATDHRHWIPCYDDPNDKLITETIITFDSKYQVLSNGTLIDTVRNPDGSLTWHYRMQKPHSLYLLMIAIGEYGIERRQTARGLPLLLYYYPDRRECCLEPTYRYTVEMVEKLEAELGVPFPWEKYAQVPVADYIYGAMENTTATVFGDFFHVDDRAYLDRSYVEVNAHELTHQWFGDYVTARSFAHLWLQESFATHYARFIVGQLFGEDAYAWGRRTEHTLALSASQKDNLPIVHPNPGYSRIYQKGSAVLDMMRYTFGNQVYRQVITYYLKKHPYDVVETNDLYQAFQDAAGLSPDWFFQQWLYRGGEPHYHVRYQSIEREGRTYTQFIVEQIQDSSIGLFRMPITFAVHYKDGSYDTVRAWIAKKQEIVEVPNPGHKPIAFALFDPGGWVLKQVTFEKGAEELLAQLEKAPFMLDRYDALVGLRQVPAHVKREALKAAYRRERFWAMRAEIAAQLATDPASLEFLKQILQDPHPQVRFAVLANLHPIPATLRPELEKLLNDSSYVVQAYALERLSEAFPRRVSEYLRLTANTTGLVGHNVRIKHLEIAALNGDRTAIEKLSDYASPAFEFRTRQNALRALKALNEMPLSLLPHLFEALTSPNPRLAGVAREVVEYWLQQTRYRQTLVEYYQRTSWSPAEKAILSPIFEYKPPTFYQRSS
ncbi:MAG: M1 family metallopeptidase [Bacteroidia bacterium]|nr:M1 family metallopeptidase [Bacteroidia bacterium]MCX7763404.1 M1 family metallopeptidase [Bacteroidia bacterium]MDW8057951.1 M1 family metallopeptidase [Bacteroidia bacterium]